MSKMPKNADRRYQIFLGGIPRIFSLSIQKEIICGNLALPVGPKWAGRILFYYSWSRMFNLISWKINIKKTVFWFSFTGRPYGFREFCGPYDSLSIQIKSI